MVSWMRVHQPNGNTEAKGSNVEGIHLLANNHSLLCKDIYIYLSHFAAGEWSYGERGAAGRVECLLNGSPSDSGSPVPQTLLEGV